MDDVVVNMGRRIAGIRKKLNLTQDQVAELTGLTTQTISSAEHGTKALRPENIVKLCQVLDVTPNDLLLNSTAELLKDVSPVMLSELSSQQRQFLEETVRILIKGMLQKE